jgi:hypothetical protein
LQKRKIIGSIFPEKITFDGSSFRTTKVNEALGYISFLNSKLKRKKNGTNQFVSDLSQEVNRIGSELFLQLIDYQF